jgi:mRNA interferase MazF
MKSGDIMLVRFPRTDLQKGKYRPVLLISRFPGPFKDWLICAITSQLKHKIAGWDNIIKKTDRDFKSSGLKVSSLIRIGKLATVEESILEGQLGKISSKRLDRILKKLVIFFEGQFIEGE